MAKPSKRRLKVFRAQFGFYDTIVAVPSQAAALRAWETRQNVFANGYAKVVTDEALVEEALAFPETVLRRPIGSEGPFQVEPTSLPEIPEAPPKRTVPKSRRPTAPKNSAPPKVVAPPPPPPADRSALSEAEGVLRKLDEDYKIAKAQHQERQAALDAEKAATEDAYATARQMAMVQVKNARQAYESAGGRD